MNPHRLIFTLNCLAAAFLTSCTTPYEPYTGPLPAMPAHWPSEQSVGEGLGSRGWDAMEKIWERALTHSPATRQQATKLHGLIWPTHPDVELRWLSATTALAAYEGGDYDIRTPQLDLCCASNDVWTKTRSYEGTTMFFESFYNRTRSQEFVFSREKFGMWLR